MLFEAPVPIFEASQSLLLSQNSAIGGLAVVRYALLFHHAAR